MIFMLTAMSLGAGQSIPATGQRVPVNFVINAAPDTDDGIREIAMRASFACPNYHFPQLGRYVFERSTGPGAAPSATQFTYRGEIKCLARPIRSEPQTGEMLRSDWRPSAADERRARATTQAYFAAVDRQGSRAFEALLAPGYSSSSTPEARAAGIRTSRAAAGAPGVHRITRVTWYVNPPLMTRGAYAEVEFDRAYANYAVSCGYIMLRRQPDGRMLVVREELASAPRHVGQTTERRAEIRRELRCRD